MRILRGACGVNPRTKQPRIIITTDAVDSERDRHLLERSRVRIPLRVLVSHNYADLPAGQVDRREQIVIEGGRMIAEFRWFEGDGRASRVKNILEQGGLDASIGVADVQGERNAHDGYNVWGEIIEFSLTPIPANRECVAVVRSLFDDRGAAVPPNTYRCDSQGRPLEDLVVIDLSRDPADDDVVEIDLDAIAPRLAAERAAAARFRNALAVYQTVERMRVVTRHGA